MDTETLVEHIFKEAKCLEIMIKHVYREINQVADYLSKMGIEQKASGAFIVDKHEKLRVFPWGDQNAIPYIRGKRSFHWMHGEQTSRG